MKPSSPINFAPPILVGSADITIDDTKVYQPVLGFGGSLSTPPISSFFFFDVAKSLMWREFGVADSSASLLNDLKAGHSLLLAIYPAF